MSAHCLFAPIPAMVAVMSLGFGACSDRAQEESKAGRATEKGQVSAPARADETASHEATDMSGLIRKLRPSTPTGEDWNAVATEMDAQNRYFATVIVGAFPPSTDPELILCSGVLVAPRLVLTAGNCVCSRRKQPAPGGGQTLIDATSCATSATITTELYEPPGPTKSGLRSTIREYAGEVRPHPSLKIVLDEQGNIVSSEADLAVIQVAGAPLLDRFSPVTLADVDLRANESLVMVSYDAWRGTGVSKRRFRQNHVTQIMDSGARALFDQPRRDVYKGDSGGPCIRETDREAALAGIMNRSLGAEASFTSTFHYRDWIRQEIQRASAEWPSPQ